MAFRHWGFLVSEKSYKVWQHRKSKKRLAVFKNIFIVSGRSYNKKTATLAKKAAMEYMRKH